MIFRTPLFALLLAAGSVCAQQVSPLDEASKQKLLENLNNLIIKSQGAEGKLIANALSLLSSGCSDGAAAQGLYFDCKKKQDFGSKDSNKVDMEKFRNWSTGDAGKTLTTQAGRRALQLQFQWAKLTLQAAAAHNKNKIDGNEFDPVTFQPQIVSFMQGVIGELKNNDKLKQLRGIIEENTLHNVVGKEYGLAGLMPPNWPRSPLAISEIFERVVFPNLRKTRNVVALRSAWDKRIECELTLSAQEDVLNDNSSPEDDSDDRNKKGKNGNSKPSRNNLMEAKATAMEKRDDLMWQKEVDLYKHGDTGTAATNMYAMILRVKDPKKQLQRVNELKNLITKSNKDQSEVAGNAFPTDGMQDDTMDMPQAPKTPKPSAQKPNPKPTKPAKPAKSAAEQAEEDFFSDV